jgi:glycerophosphoryl diester phosphodiesterase
VVRGEASWHGDYHDMRHQGNLALVDDRLVVYSEPGKHAFAPTPEWFIKRREERVRSETSALAGCGGVLVARYFEGMIPKGPLEDLLVRSYLSQRAFEPSLDFSRTFEFSPDMLVPWPALLEWIPTRVNAWLDRLRAEILPSGYRFWRIGHRGARAHAPDNTLSSFRKAAELGADLVELDVQCTADGHVVVLHDRHLVDPEGKIWPVQGSTLAELQAIDVGGGEHVPTLGEALEVCRAENIGAYVELKDGDAVPAVAASLREWKLGPHSIVGSFRPDWLAALKALDPTVQTSVLFSSPEVDAVKLAQSVGASYVHPCWERFPHPSSLLTTEWVGRVREAGLGIICWHEERPEEIAALRQVGVDGICSDAPELLLGAAGEAS